MLLVQLRRSGWLVGGEDPGPCRLLHQYTLRWGGVRILLAGCLAGVFGGQMRAAGSCHARLDAPGAPRPVCSCACREGGQYTPHILADVFEALLGALYLDAGWAAAHAFCRRVMSACVDWSQVEADAEDWKGVFRWGAGVRGGNVRGVLARGGCGKVWEDWGGRETACQPCMRWLISLNSVSPLPCSAAWRRTSGGRSRATAPHPRASASLGAACR